ncbi:LysM peptidoglycan-binding domain-containing protein [Hymenobacter sp. BT175]|uniref:LysM peptidoglycan-binding domain-containing protein n=1 Tax=Hymenobacter translucens TaxID=2886507 RepID=UPI001D0E3225|nr:LysM peptidoglycan-binding domain-containing protein [Hymenobacter translucens]MCC2546898.1 LysM peptidoglycan-binding domain-containing protein [Hymenobacter translucens]
MTRLFTLLLCLLPLLGVSQQRVVVPTEIPFAGLRLRLNDGARAAIQQKVDALTKHQPSFQAHVTLADAYFPLIDRVFQEEGLPLDFRYLAIQESGLQGEAQSIHDAVGYWQFKRDSGLDFGLLINDVVDERKHVVASSRAAAKYLLRNNRTFHNWLNTLLSYNLGLTGAKPYTLPTDYDATLADVTEKTPAYLLTFLAHKLAFEPVCGLNPKPALLIREFPAAAGQKLPAIAEALQTNPDQLARHNRWLLPGAAVPADRPFTVLVPVTDPLQLTAMAAQQKIATRGQLLNEPAPDPQSVEFVRVNGLRALIALPGESKEGLAKRAGMKMRKFMRLNDLFAFDNIIAGQPYYTQAKRDKAEVEYHVAQPGESLTLISQKYGVRAKAIQSKNRMARNEELRPGRLLWMQHTRPKEVAVEYAEGKDQSALAAFERPATRPTAAAQPASAPQPAEPATKPNRKQKPAEVEPYRGQTAAEARLLEDETPDTAADSTAAAGVAQADAAVENLNDLPPTPVAPTTAPVKASVPVTATSSAPSAPAPKPVRKELPAPTPVADEPQAEAVAATPAAKPAPAPVVAAPEPAAKAPAPKPERTVAQAAPSAAAAPEPVAKPAASPVTAPVASPKAEPAPVAAASATKPATLPAPVPPTFAVPPTKVEPVPANGLHVVEKSENLYSVARRFALRPADIVAWNNLPVNPSLRLGQTLRVAPPVPAATAPAPVPASTPAATPAAPARHTVAAGETLYSIARRYGVKVQDILAWSNKPDSSLRPGEVLVVQAPQ